MRHRLKLFFPLNFSILIVFEMISWMILITKKQRKNHKQDSHNLIFVFRRESWIPLIATRALDTSLLWKWWRTNKNSSSRCSRTEISYTYKIAARWKRKRWEKEHTNRFVWFTLSKATSTGGKNRKLFIMVAVYKWKLILYRKYRASLPYIGRGQNRKITE